VALEKLDTEIRREQIVEAALSLIAAHGVRRLSVGALARRVGLVPSALYRHFRSKQEILDAALQLVQRRALENLREVCTATPDALERLELLLTRVIKMVRDLQALPRIVFSEGMSADQPERKRQAYRILKGLLSAIEGIIRDGQQRGEVRTDFDAQSLAVMFWGMLPPAVILWHVSEGRFDVTRHAERSWDLFREAIRAR
jgi:TetR/AcrR family transcriptional regulator, fatty acid metabolism regulator protein